MGNQRKIKVGVFGAYRGMTMINVMARHPDAELVAICDKYEPLLERCKKVAEETGSKITYYTNFDDFFNHDMDAVVLANYANEHAPFAIRLLLFRPTCGKRSPACRNPGPGCSIGGGGGKKRQGLFICRELLLLPGYPGNEEALQAGDIGEFMHGEGEYVHNCEPIWPRITYGDKNHWRNRMYSTYYCTHSLGPILTITGERPVKVVGFETPNAEYMAKLGYGGGTSGMIVAQMSNGATVKSLHGNLKREPSSVWYCIYGDKGMMESDRWHEGVHRIHLFRDEEKITDYEVSYRPKPRVTSKLADDFRHEVISTQCIISWKKFWAEDGENCIDVYQALDMGLPGILAYRSICNGNVPITVPDFRNPEERTVQERQLVHKPRNSRG